MPTLPMPAPHSSSIDLAAQRIHKILEREERQKRRTRHRRSSGSGGGAGVLPAMGRANAAEGQIAVGLLDALLGLELPSSPHRQRVAVNGQPSPEPCRLKSDAYTDANMVPRICVYSCPEKRSLASLSTTPIRDPVRRRGTPSSCRNGRNIPRRQSPFLGGSGCRRPSSDRRQALAAAVSSPGGKARLI
jgi:hypothetical protein